MLSLVVVMLALQMVVPGAIPLASAACTSTDWHVQGYDPQYEGTSFARGLRADINTQAFDRTQCRSVRSIAITYNSGNLVEFGYVNSGSSSSTVFEVVLYNSVYHQWFPGPNPGAGSNHSYKIQNGNQNSWWAFTYDGNTFPDSRQASFTIGNTALSNSEVDAQEDSAWAHFWAIRECRQLNCPSYVDPGGWGHMPIPASKENPNYKFCWISKNEHFVKQSC